MDAYIEARRNRQVRTLTASPVRLGEWVRDLWGHREVVVVMARKDFQVRYKRAVLGVLWAVLQPLLQALVMVAVFSRLLRNVNDAPYSYGAFVLAGVLAWTYLVSTLSVASTSIVDGANLTEKVWFPRAILAIVPGLSNLVGLGASGLILIALMPLLGARYTSDLALLGPAVLLLLAFVTALGLCLSALHVYFRDVRYLVSASLLLWFYVTPVIYPGSLLGVAGRWLELNPMTGIVGLFQRAIVGPAVPIGRPLLVSIFATVVLAGVGIAAQRRYDRLFVDLL